MALKKSSFSREIRPFSRDVSSALTSVKYRSASSKDWQDVLAGGVLVLQVDDLRYEAIHEIQLQVDRSQLEAVFGPLASSLSIVVLTRDAATRRVLTLARHTVGDLPTTFVLDAATLQASSLASSMKIELRLLLPSDRAVGIGEARHKGTWLAQAKWTLTREPQGPGFNYRKATAAEFSAQRKPSDTAWWVKVDCDDVDLFDDIEDPSSLFEVWIHEDVWVTLQEIGQTEASEAVGKMCVSAVATAVLQRAAQVASKTKPGASCIVTRLISWIAERTGATPEILLAALVEGRANDLEPFLQSALGMNKTLKSLDLRPGA